MHGNQTRGYRVMRRYISVSIFIFFIFLPFMVIVTSLYTTTTEHELAIFHPVPSVHVVVEGMIVPYSSTEIKRNASV